jgi:hypothetical protein
VMRRLGEWEKVNNVIMKKYVENENNKLYQ